MLSQTSEHALRAVLYLARQADDASVPADVIAEALGAPPKYLAKTLNVLAKEGILRSMRGPTGGFRLAVGADRLTLARVIQPFDAPRNSGMCLLGGQPCDARKPCAAHAHWTAISEKVWAPLENSTVAELLNGAGPELEVSGITRDSDRDAAGAPPEEGR